MELRQNEPWATNGDDTKVRECNALGVAILAVSAASETPSAAVEDDDNSEPAASAESAAPPVPDTALLHGRRDGWRRGGAQGV